LNNVLGTGKTTVARLYASFLVEVGVLPEDCVVVETAGAALISGGVRELKKVRDRIRIRVLDLRLRLELGFRVNVRVGG
jgi:hypothetical protein